MKNTLFAVALWAATSINPSLISMFDGPVLPKNDTLELVETVSTCRIEGNIIISDIKEGKAFYDNDLSPLLKSCRKTFLRIEQAEKGTYKVSGLAAEEFTMQQSIENNMEVNTKKPFRLFRQGKQFQKDLRKNKVLFVTVEQLDTNIFKINYKG